MPGAIAAGCSEPRLTHIRAVISKFYFASAKGEYKNRTSLLSYIISCCVLRLPLHFVLIHRKNTILLEKICESNYCNSLRRKNIREH